MILYRPILTTPYLAHELFTNTHIIAVITDRHVLLTLSAHVQEGYSTQFVCHIDLKDGSL